MYLMVLFKENFNWPVLTLRNMYQNMNTYLGNLHLYFNNIQKLALSYTIM